MSHFPCWNMLALCLAVVYELVQSELMITCSNDIYMRWCSVDVRHRTLRLEEDMSPSCHKGYHRHTLRHAWGEHWHTPHMHAYTSVCINTQRQVACHCPTHLPLSEHCKTKRQTISLFQHLEDIVQLIQLCVYAVQERRRRMRPLHVRTVLRTHGPPTLLRWGRHLLHVLYWHATCRCDLSSSVANDLVGGTLSGGRWFVTQVLVDAWMMMVSLF